ncbi:thiamine pyrophosphate-binding protein [Rhizobium puerariae]|uniref:Thiamine pyrophosphate-binding protein n=1 Tax=Rhizobium puerariae TaxID=1585791 RepID=A0ABV6AEH4_9HYPH
MNGGQSSRTVHEVVADTLAACGAECLFGLIGDGNLFMVDSFVRSKKGRYIPATHEAAAVLMALGHAQRTGRTGVATITHGPALTNALTALTEGVKGGIPLVLVCGDTPPDNLQHLQKINQRELIAAAGAGFVELRKPETVAEDIATAFRRACLERRPVVLNMRVDLQWEPSSSIPMKLRMPETRALVPTSADLDEALGIIASARRPIILAGRGAAGTEAREALIRLSRQIEAPLTTTLKASGLFEGEAWNLGVFGGLSHPVAVELIMQSDCIIAFGASLSRHTTESGSFVRGKCVIQIMSRATDLATNVVPQIGIVGDPALTADIMCEMLRGAEIEPSGFATGEAPKLENVIAQAAGRQDNLPDGVVDLDTALVKLNEAVPSDRTLVTDLGRFVTTAWLAFPVRAPEKFIHTVHFGAIGFGLGQAIGAAVGSAGEPTVMVAGDGGFMLGGLSEISTAVREKLDLIIVICNDASYGAEHIQFTNRSMSPALSLIGSPDFAGIARSMGAAGISVRSAKDIETACEAVRQRSGPLLIDLKLGANHVPMR